MHQLPLRFRDGHLFVETNGALWLLDTGAPHSFGDATELCVAERRFPIARDFGGIGAQTLSELIGVPCQGLIGGDVLGGFDHIFDLPRGLLAVSAAELSHAGAEVPLDDFIGVPIVMAGINGSDHRMFFDTGAQISYLRPAALAGFPSAGRFNDFYPGMGRFETDTHEVRVRVGGIGFTLRCGTLPGLLEDALLLAGTEGIVGNSILRDRAVAYFPRRRMMVIPTEESVPAEG